jgi:hypothetical protein
MTALAVTGLFAVLFLSCGGQTLNPKFQPEISNLPDNFQFQATGMTGVTQTLSYNWTTTGIQADVNQACSISGGGATILIRDAQDTVVYTRNLADNGTFTTNAGVAGTWKIQVALSNVQGTVNFRVQKKP